VFQLVERNSVIGEAGDRAQRRRPNPGLRASGPPGLRASGPPGLRASGYPSRPKAD
jgi:hypothetical protein